MKGPFERVKYDLRRVWECPVCNQRARTEGHVTSQFCKCQQSAEPATLVPMRLVADGIRRVH
jgi:hypothetical protein